MPRIYPFARLTLLPLIRFFTKKIVGLEHVPMEGPYIIACKHLGALDGAFVGAAIIPKINRKIHFFANVAKWGWFWEKIVSERWAGSIPFYRDHPRASLEIAMGFLREGRVIGIFPEGILQDYGQRGRAKTGVARMAIWAKVPIVPVGLVHDISVRADLSRLYRRRQVIKNILLNPHSLEIHIGQPFTLEEYYHREMTLELLVEATNNVMRRIEALTKINIVS